VLQHQDHQAYPTNQITGCFSSSVKEQQQRIIPSLFNTEISIDNSITSSVHELQSLFMTGIHFNIKNLYGNIPRASAAPRLAATLGSSRSVKYFEMISLAIFTSEDTRYIGIKCFNASTAAHWTKTVKKKEHSVYKSRWFVSWLYSIWKVEVYKQKRDWLCIKSHEQLVR